MLILVLLASAISFRVSAVTINPGFYFSIGNENYTVNQTMNFENITISSSYIIFNDTGFYVSSGNDITITLVYINDDIAGAGDGEKVLEFYGDTIVGTVWFNLSGFPAGNDYVVDRSSISIATPTANGSSFISFTNSVWSSQLFEIFQVGDGVGNNQPAVSNIQDQTILEGASFAQINLDNYVTDIEDPDDDIDWSYSGNADLLVSIVNRAATISTPNSDWYGVETITFTAEDTGGLTDSDDATFMVIAHDAPVLSGLSISNGANDVSVSTSSLSITIEDPNGDSIDWAIETSPNIGSNSGSNDSNGSKSCSISGLAYSTTYYWFVNATDGTYWANGSYSFTTESAPSNNPPVSPPGGGGQDVIPEQNNPPDTPVKPSGPTLIEMGVEYMYTSSTVDVDGDEIRFRFDWGDGNYSDWSEFIASNTSVSMSHYWASISTFEVRVMAQDENGLNSSWSLSLDVTVSQTASGEVPPVADINAPSTVSVNQTIVFDASGSFDEDGVIVSYYWDFGDGENGSGISPSHVYKDPGQYNVTLVVTDNNGITYSKSIIVNIASKEESSEEKQGGLQFDFGTIFIGFAMILLVCLIVFFRNNIKSFVSAHRAPPFPPWKIMDTISKMEKVNAKIEGLKKGVITKTDFKLSSVGMGDTYPDEIQKRHDRICRFIDSEIASTSKEKDVFDGFDKVYTGEKVDKLIRTHV